MYKNFHYTNVKNICHKEKFTNLHYTISMQSRFCCTEREKNCVAKTFGMEVALRW